MKHSRNEIIEQLRSFVIGYQRYPQKVEYTKENGLSSFAITRKVLGKGGVTGTGILKEEYFKSFPKICLSCDNVIPYNVYKNQTFCSIGCANVLRKRKVLPLGQSSKGRINILHPKMGKICENCSLKFFKTDLISSSSFRRLKYCSTNCASHSMKWNRINQWLEGKLYGGNSATMRSWLIEIYGHQCSSCHTRVWMKLPIPLEVEHIDGNSENNTVENVILLCPNCHALTPTYKGRNRGHGRHKRRQRYMEGKSY